MTHHSMQFSTNWVRVAGEDGINNNSYKHPPEHAVQDILVKVSMCDSVPTCCVDNSMLAHMRAHRSSHRHSPEQFRTDWCGEQVSMA